MIPHDWALSWPGNFCKRCGIDDPLESDEALIRCDAPNCNEAKESCPRCAGTGCIVNPNLVIPSCVPEDKNGL
jgi:hypothetical protein